MWSVVMDLREHEITLYSAVKFETLCGLKIGEIEDELEHIEQVNVLMSDDLYI